MDEADPAAIAAAAAATAVNFRYLMIGYSCTSPCSGSTKVTLLSFQAIASYLE
jgi:hypothetical protein